MKRTLRVIATITTDKKHLHFIFPQKWNNQQRWCYYTMHCFTSQKLMKQPQKPVWNSYARLSSYHPLQETIASSLFYRAYCSVLKIDSSRVHRTIETMEACSYSSTNTEFLTKLVIFSTSSCSIWLYYEALVRAVTFQNNFRQIFTAVY